MARRRNGERLCYNSAHARSVANVARVSAFVYTNESYIACGVSWVIAVLGCVVSLLANRHVLFALFFLIAFNALLVALLAYLSPAGVGRIPLYGLPAALVGIQIVGLIAYIVPWIVIFAPDAATGTVQCVLISVLLFAQFISSLVMLYAALNLGDAILSNAVVNSHARELAPTVLPDAEFTYKRNR